MTAPARRSPTKGAVFALCGALLFGINGSVAKVVIEAGVSPTQLTFLRTLSTAVIAGVVLVLSAREQFLNVIDSIGCKWMGAEKPGGLPAVGGRLRKSIPKIHSCCWIKARAGHVSNRRMTVCHL